MPGCRSQRTIGIAQPDTFLDVREDTRMTIIWRRIHILTRKQAMRAYEKTHAHISFALSLAALPPKFWMLMGEARSKCDHIALVPLAPSTARDLHAVYFAKGVHATTAIEDNTLSEDEVRRRMEGGLELPPSKEYLGQEIDNMLRAYNEIQDKAVAGSPIELTVDTLKHFNRVILRDLPDEPEVIPGEIRTHSVAVGPYVGAPAEDCDILLDRLVTWLHEIQPSDPSEAVPIAVIKAVVAHVYLEWIHPFGNGNGRLGRLIEFLILTSSGITIPAAHVLTSHYNDTRAEYYRQLHHASRSGGDLIPFLIYAAQGFVDGLLGQIKRLHSQHEKLMWRQFIDEVYEGQAAESASRRRKLAIKLGETDAWVERDDIMLLDRYLARAYASKTDKTVSRDLNQLEREGFVELSGNRMRARTEKVAGMRAFTATEGSDPTGS